MSVEGLLNNTATVYRMTESLDALREKNNTYTALPVAEMVAVDVRNERSEDEGAGEARRGVFPGFARYAANIQKFDVLKLTAGPESPAQFTVRVINRPRGSHTEMELERFAGALP